MKNRKVSNMFNTDFNKEFDDFTNGWYRRYRLIAIICIISIISYTGFAMFVAIHSDKIYSDIKHRVISEIKDIKNELKGQ
jgi:hypothetical protein